jgi:RNA polymerase sigma-70 factor (ECF subfamily)
MSGSSEDRLDVFLERAENALPALEVARADFLEFFAAHPARDSALQSEAGEGVLELYLVFALKQKSPAAERAFETRYLQPLGKTLARLRLSDSQLDEVKQHVREKLLVGMRVEEYAGQGRLSGLLQVVATREALTLFRKLQRQVALDDRGLADPIAERWDPGLEMLKGRARDAFRDAFEQAVKRLEPRERNLLRLHLLGGVTLEQLAKLHSVHRATVVRWLAAARERVLSETRAKLGQELELSGAELESVMNAAQSRLDLSVERLFRSQASFDGHD